MNKETALGHVALKYTKWPNPSDTTPTAHRGWYWVKKNGLIPSMVFQSIDSRITRGEYEEWRSISKPTPLVDPPDEATPPKSPPLSPPNYASPINKYTDNQPVPSPPYDPDNALQWCVDNIIVWPTLDAFAPPPPEWWVWSSSLSQTHKSLALINEHNAVMAVIAKVDWDNAKGDIPKSDSSQWVSNRVDPIMKFFEFKHLPEHLQQASEPICSIAHAYDTSLPDGPEKTEGLRKLLEAKDCFVRAVL